MQREVLKDYILSSRWTIKTSLHAQTVAIFIELYQTKQHIYIFCSKHKKCCFFISYVKDYLLAFKEEDQISWNHLKLTMHFNMAYL